MHGPHHIFGDWADRYKGKFDDGWDKYRQRVFKRQKKLGWIPKNAKLTDRHPDLDPWHKVLPQHRNFQRRLMEVFAGFVEHTDVQVGRLIDGLKELYPTDADNGKTTLIFYIFGDNVPQVPHRQYRSQG
ncbi:MAG: hypothetical protein ETSY2_38120 [Candidatus Entotheonella gemina]|uniref:Sulfatase N-terminal domain-containing protein n=1 Tax=Candidatus Entotheonella gemina TaxID=1429439 RepID=W4LU28_9BACT|nr:MAG: hypothetical protein ETSY2_38120 [Candidatus Entotheonella gemina]